MRTIFYREINDVIAFKKQLLQWSQQFREIVFLDSNDYNQKYSNYDLILAVDAFTSVETDYYNAFQDLYEYQSRTKDWLFGYLTYDLKNDIEKLSSNNFDGLSFPDLFFFQPKKLFLLKDTTLEIQYLQMCDDEFETDFNEILNIARQPSIDNVQPIINQRISKENYLNKVSKMLEHIQRGDIYEANFCMEFFAENAQINPILVYQKLF